MDQSFERGYVTALLAVMMFGLLWAVISLWVEDPGQHIRSLRAIHRRDQEEASKNE